jgi:hypothetical protein
MFIRQLATADNTKRDEMLEGYLLKSGKPSESGPSVDGKHEGSTDIELAFARARTGQLRKLRAGNASQFFGGTSLFQIHVGDDAPTPTFNGDVDAARAQGGGFSPSFSPSALSESAGQFPYSPHDEMCQHLMAQYFKEQYPYHMCVYREFFLRDYDTGAGRYYSEVLLFAICAMGALAAADPSMVSVSETFANHAEFLVYTSLDSPDLTLLQALILLGYRAIGHGKASKGW